MVLEAATLPRGFDGAGNDDGFLVAANTERNAVVIDVNAQQQQQQYATIQRQYSVHAQAYQPYSAPQPIGYPVYNNLAVPPLEPLPQPPVGVPWQWNYFVAATPVTAAYEAIPRTDDHVNEPPILRTNTASREDVATLSVQPEAMEPKTNDELEISAVKKDAIEDILDLELLAGTGPGKETTEDRIANRKAMLSRFSIYTDDSGRSEEDSDAGYHEVELENVVDVVEGKK
ncbi:hypothetical protein HDU99_005396 [Rhizoclosmatium hyalinum]|nr:hypothetical protein HDU99_005396 [Rhizoclosmatium hyalinum]